MSQPFMPQITYYLGLFALWLVLSFLVARAATSFRRPPGTWFLISLFVGPVIALILLFVLGDPQDTEARREKEERIRRRHPERTDIREAAMNEMNCPRCGAEVNVVTCDGLHTAESEPWLLFCNNCDAQIEPDV
jgi:hypothetical protein